MFTRDPRGAAVLGGFPLADLLHRDDEPRASSDEPPASGEAAPRSGLVAGGVRTPVYVYDLGGMAAAARELAQGFGAQPHLIAYALKANSAGAVVRALAEAGCGADVVSGGELGLALACGISPEKILYSGVAKTDDELDRALSAGERGIRAIQVESVEEIARVDARAARLGRPARVSLRVKPGISADTHAHIVTGHDDAKFGVARDDLTSAWAALAAAPNVQLVGLSVHIGSQLLTPATYLEAADVLLEIARDREMESGQRLDFLDFGGGFGIDYGGTSPSPPWQFAAGIAERLARSPLAGRTAVVEPGRALVGPHGVLCASVVMAKRSGPRRWLLIDAGMNDLIRPALYGAHHRIEPLDLPAGEGAVAWRVAGPVCESADDFGEHRFEDPPATRVVIRDAGAYGFVMASAYNGRPRAAEVFLQGGAVVSINAAGQVDDWIADRAGAGIALR